MQRRDEQGEEGKSRERQPDSPGRCHFTLNALVDVMPPRVVGAPD